MDKMASQKNEYPIHPLSPVIEKEDDISEYKIYKGCLDSAFKNPDVRNIAITGNFGIGKSRFLRYFAKTKKYLFVSGCSFYEQGKPDDDDSVEYNLLYQLLLGCKQKKESRRKARSFFQKAGFFVTILFLLATVFLLTLAPKLGPYLRALGWYNKAGSNWIHALVYIGFVFSLCVDALWLITNGKRVLKLRSISLELGGAKVEAEKAESESPLYKNREELIHTLVESADKIDRTVIFEDMDRLGPCCVDLFTKLWELNKLVNLCLDNNKPLRFVYVIHDELFSLASDKRKNSSSTETEKATKQEAKQTAPDSYVQLKFFDYILPIVPSMSGKDAMVAAKNLIQDEDVNELITLLAPYLYDYRLLRSIANEYNVFCQIYNDRFNLTKVGSLMICNKVTVNGKETTGNSADGTYTFIITGANNYFSTHEIKITNGESNSVQVDNLLPGTYTVTEAAPNGAELVGGNFLRVEVEANNTANVPTADFTNNKVVQPGFIDSLICFFSSRWNYLKNLFARVFKAHCRENPPHNIPNEEKKKILGFSVYKNLMPDDYKKIRDGKSVVFSGSQDRGDDTNLPESIRLLIKNEWLDDTCLHLVGYDREGLKECIKGAFEKGNETAGQKKFWLEHELILYCEQFKGRENATPNLVGVEFTFAALALTEEGKDLYEIIKTKLIDSFAEAKETCSVDLLKKIHTGLGLGEKPPVLGLPERKTVLEYLLSLQCSELWKFVPGSNEDFNSKQNVWWELIKDLDETSANKLEKQCAEPLKTWAQSIEAGVLLRKIPKLEKDKPMFLKIQSYTAK